MKNSILKIAIVTVLTSTLIGFESAVANNNSNQVTKTTIQNGEIYPLINLPAVEISASGVLKQKVNANSEIELFYENSSQLLLVKKHNGEFLPSVLLNEAKVVAYQSPKIAASGFKKVLSGFYGFILNYAIHYGFIN